MSPQSILLPYPEHLTLLNVLTVLVMLIHLLYIFLLLGSTALSVHCLVQDKIEPSTRVRRLAGDLSRLVPTNFAVYLMLGFIPLPTLMLVYSEWFYQTNFELFKYFGFIALATLAGLILIYLYARMMQSKTPNFFIALNTGGPGVTLLIGAYYVFANVIGMTLRPESWALTPWPVPWLFEANSFARALLYLHLAFALTGLGVLFFWFNWHKMDFDESYGNFVRNFGLVVSSLAVLVLPLLIIWNAMTMPQSSYSIGVFILNALALILLIGVSISIYNFISHPGLAITKTPFVLLIFVFFALILSDEVGKENANLGHAVFIADLGEKVKFDLEQKRTSGEKVVADLGLGEKVYKGRCMTCHAFDHKVVGPPHNEVLPKYYNDQDTLKQFILHPHKVNPAYPEMPPQPLTKKEVESVVAYMMKHIEDEKLVTPAPPKPAVSPVAEKK